MNTLNAAISKIVIANDKYTMYPKVVEIILNLIIKWSFSFNGYSPVPIDHAECLCQLEMVTIFSTSSLSEIMK